MAAAILKRRGRTSPGCLSSSQPLGGRILAVVTSAEHTLDGQGRAGFELTELSRAWWVFESAGFEVELASPAGGAAPRVVDDGLVDADYAFLNEPRMQAHMAQTLPLDGVDSSRYDAVYIVGGKGAMIDLHDHPGLKPNPRRGLPSWWPDRRSLPWACRAAERGNCSGQVPVAGSSFPLSPPPSTGFTNAEELFLMEDPVARLGFHAGGCPGGRGPLQRGAHVPGTCSHRRTGAHRPEPVVDLGPCRSHHNGRWAWSRPRARAVRREHAVDLLALLHAQGYEAARAAKPVHGAGRQPLIADAWGRCRDSRRAQAADRPDEARACLIRCLADWRVLLVEDDLDRRWRYRRLPGDTRHRRLITRWGDAREGRGENCSNGASICGCSTCRRPCPARMA